MANNNINNDLILDQNITVIIPSAGLVNSACNYNLAYKDPWFLNIGSSLAIDEVRKKLKPKIVLAVKSTKNKFFKLKPFSNIQLVEVGDTKNITETIKITLKFIETEWCLINQITTIPISNDFSKSFVEFGSSMLPKENWASLIFNKEGLSKFFSKVDKNSEGLESYPFTGRIFAKTRDLNCSINELRENQKNDLSNLAYKLFNKSKVQIKYNDWLDIGHLATYPNARTSSINSRFFNKLTYDKNKNIITKKSKNKKKIDQEVSFYKTMSKDLKRYFPRIFNIENNKFYSSYEMDYISKPNLSEIYLFGEIGPNAILRIFNSIESVFKKFYEKQILIEENANWLYSLKIESRQIAFEKIIKKSDFNFLRKIYNSDFKVNNYQIPSLSRTFDFLKKELVIFEKKRPIHIGHGDLCFNNILVDPVYGSINLIDPKAEKHFALDKYGLIDSFYDLSKLNHSIEGLYDSIVNNLFNLKIHDIDNISFEVYQPKEYEYYKKYFNEIISEKRIDNKILRLLTANLFFNMLPMHVENVEKVISLSLIGSILISQLSMKEIVL